MSTFANHQFNIEVDDCESAYTQCCTRFTADMWWVDVVSLGSWSFKIYSYSLIRMISLKFLSSVHSQPAFLFSNTNGNAGLCFPLITLLLLFRLYENYLFIYLFINSFINSLCSSSFYLNQVIIKSFLQHSLYILLTTPREGIKAKKMARKIERKQRRKSRRQDRKHRRQNERRMRKDMKRQSRHQSEAEEDHVAGVEWNGTPP